MTDKNNNNQWDARSRNESNKNFVLGAHYGNPWNNTNNPNWLNSMVENPSYRKSMLNDPQRVEKRNLVEDNNGNKKVMKDYPINPS